MSEQTLVLANVVEAWLEDSELSYTITRQRTRSEFETTIQMDNSSYRVLLCSRERLNFFGVYAYMPFNVAEEHRAHWLDITSRANWGYEYARLEINPVDGQFRCSSTAVLPESTLSKAMVEKMTMFTVGWLDAAFPALQMLAEENSLQLCPSAPQQSS